ncbi:RHS repeat domain-containing protein [Streptomyces sp. NPDC052292]|uniref:RHS repeat domain-containing protein n=1 Tax=unclassified Streptomyces TaxID=2593676 RepID=UPI00118022FD
MDVHLRSRRPAHLETDFDGSTQQYAYDAAGQLTARTNAAGQTVHYVYAAVGQLARKTWAGR